MGTSHEKVRLVPFDSASEAHAQRMYLQRVACGWSEDEVAAWREHCEAGKKGIWWLVSLSFLGYTGGLMARRRNAC